jgi:hypothetical protein
MHLGRWTLHSDRRQPRLGERIQPLPLATSYCYIFAKFLHFVYHRRVKLLSMSLTYKKEKIIIPQSMTDNVVYQMK